MNKTARNFEQFNRRSDIPEFALFLGTVVGVGIFALPGAFNHCPRIAFLILVISAAILYSLYHFYIDLILKKGMGFHQLPGIVNKVFGSKAKHLSTVLLMIGRSGIIFLYILIIGDFSSLILENIFGLTVNSALIAVIIAILCSIAVRKKIKVVTSVQLALTGTMIFIIAGVSLMGLLLKFRSGVTYLPTPISDELSNLGQNPLEFLKGLGLVYGVSVGALSGIASIPSLKELNRNPKALNRILIFSSIIVVLLYALFVTFVVLHSGTVSPDALHGLGNHWWVDLLAVAGLLCVTTSLIGIGNSIFEVYNLDYNVPENYAWLFTFVPPIVLYASPINDFTKAAALIGGVVGGAEGILILSTYWKEEQFLGKLTPKKTVSVILLGIVLLAGIFLSL